MLIYNACCTVYVFLFIILIDYLLIINKLMHYENGVGTAGVLYCVILYCVVYCVRLFPEKHENVILSKTGIDNSFWS
jgi:hypothetical protein